MKDLAIGGELFRTTDAVADAVIEIALALGVRGGAELVELPCALDGSVSTVRIALPAGAPVAAFYAPGTGNGVLEGADEAAERLRGQADALRAAAD